jgi:adenylate cyclase
MTEQRRLAAILVADVVGYSKLVGSDEAGTLAELRTLRSNIIEPAIAKHAGRLFKSVGDGFLVEFASAVQAVTAAQAIQQANAGGALALRIGIHVGDVVVQGDDLMGDGVNVAARIEGVAGPGGIALSRAVHEQVRDKLDLAFSDKGEIELRNIARPVQVFLVGGDVAAAPVPTAALALPDRPSIAVLPFQNMSGDAEQEYFADGMVEDIITALSRFKSLFVIARNSSFTYKGRAVDIKQVGRELGVRYVLEGSIRKGGNRVRLTAQLIDALSGAHVWAERYDRDLSDVFAVQDELTASVAGLIEPALTAAEQQRVLRKPPDRLDAWEAYQRGLWHFHRYRADDNTTALAFYRQAIALDRNFAPGHYGYALALQWEIWHFSDRPFAEVQGTPRDEAFLAVTLDDKDAMAHAVLAHILMWNGEWEAAIAEARTAIGLNPNNAFVIAMLGCVLTFGGYRDEGLDQLRRAMRASPQDPLTWLWTMWTAATHFYSRRFEAALETLDHLLRLRPENMTAHYLRAASLAHLGRLDDAQNVLARLSRQFPGQLQRMEEKPPWVRPQDFAIREEVLRRSSLTGRAPPRRDPDG